jgi:hypothetical protein
VCVLSSQDDSQNTEAARQVLAKIRDTPKLTPTPSIDPAHAILALLVFFVGEQGMGLTVLLR